MKVPGFIADKIAGLIVETSRLEQEVEGHGDEHISKLSTELSGLTDVLIALREEIEAANDQELPDEVETTLVGPACILAVVEKLVANPNPAPSGLSAYGWRDKTIDSLISFIQDAKWEIEMLPALLELAPSNTNSVASLESKTGLSDETRITENSEDWVSIDNSDDMTESKASASSDTGSTKSTTVDSISGDQTETDIAPLTESRGFEIDAPNSPEPTTTSLHTDAEDSTVPEPSPTTKYFLMDDFWRALDEGDAAAVSHAITQGTIDPLQKRAVPNSDGLNANMPLHRAAQAGHVQVLTTLLNHGVPVDQLDDNNETALHYAAWFGSATCAAILIERGASVDQGSLFGSPPLLWACQNGHADVIDLLLDMGASFDASSPRDGESPVGIAAFSGHWEAVKTLLARGARADKPNDDGYTPAHWAAEGGHGQILRDVLKYGADVNAETTDAHFTPLHLAAAEGRTETARILLEHGADLTKIAKIGDDEDGEQWTPAEAAMENGFVELGHLLEDWVKLLARFKSLAANPWQVELRIDI